VKRLLTALIAVVALAIVPASAMAKDRNHDKIPDKWEKRHHLSLHHDQARRDQDKDGLRNLAEYRAGTDPRDADSDNDGIEDGDENAGTVKSFEGGVLTIALAKGGEVSGTVTDTTEIECDDQGEDEPGDDSGDDHGGERIARASHDGGDDACTTAALTTGAVVKEAELEVAAGTSHWQDIELLG
jgi:hypothetical protein